MRKIQRFYALCFNYVIVCEIIFIHFLTSNQNDEFCKQTYKLADNVISHSSCTSEAWKILNEQ